MRTATGASICSSPTSAATCCIGISDRDASRTSRRRPVSTAARDRWGSGCSLLDIDRDGDLDLFVANYLSLDLATAPEPGQGANCTWKGLPVNCGPKGLATDTNLLYRNNGDGTFTDVSAASGVSRVTGRYSMTAAAADLDGDGWIDIYVATDSTAAILYRNNHDGTFTDVALPSGAAYNELGSPQAGMGLALGDVDADGALDILKTHFADDIPALYREPRPRAVRGRGDAGRSRRAEPLRAVGRGAARSRQRRLDGRVLRDRQRLSRGRGEAAAVSPPQPAHRLSQRRRRALRRRHRVERPRGDDAAVESRGGVRRHRPGWRRRCAGDEHERAAVAAAQRLAERPPLADGAARGHAIESTRDRRDRPRHERRTHAGPRRAQPDELLLGRRSAAVVRPRRRDSPIGSKCAGRPAAWTS